MAHSGTAHIFIIEVNTLYFKATCEDQESSGLMVVMGSIPLILLVSVNTKGTSARLGTFPYYHMH